MTFLAVVVSSPSSLDFAKALLLFHKISILCSKSRDSEFFFFVAFHFGFHSGAFGSHEPLLESHLSSDSPVRLDDVRCFVHFKSHLLDHTLRFPTSHDSLSQKIHT